MILKQLVDSFPRKMIQAVQESPNIVRVLTSEADNNFTYTFGNEYFTEILSIYFMYISTATVGNREIFMTLLDSSTNRIFHTRAVTTQAASLNYPYCVTQGYGASYASGALIYMRLPIGLVMPPGSKLQLYDANGTDVADTFDVINIIIKKHKGA